MTQAPEKATNTQGAHQARAGVQAGHDRCGGAHEAQQRQAQRCGCLVRAFDSPAFLALGVTASTWWHRLVCLGPQQGHEAAYTYNYRHPMQPVTFEFLDTFRVV